VRRRQVVTSFALTALYPLSGCTESIESGIDDTPTPTQSLNPWGKEQLSVGLVQQVYARHDIHDIVKEALGYWEQNAQTFAGYDISFRYRPNSDEVDIQIVLVSEIRTCGEHSGEYAGCADILEGRSPNTAEIRIVDGYRREWMVKTLIHELGHTLGLDHDDEPAHLMSNAMEDRIPDYQERRDAIQKYSDSVEPYNYGWEKWSQGVDLWDEEQYVEAESALVDAHNYFIDARKLVDSARVIVDKLNEAEALSLIEETFNNVENRRKAADAAIEMAREAQQENWDRVEEYREEANGYLDTADRYDFDNYEEFVVALGFPRP
jgi:hypothetical protein